MCYIFSEVGIGIFPLWNFPIITIFSQVLVWPLMRPYMVENVELLYVGHNCMNIRD